MNDPALAPYDGPVESALPGSIDELLRELIAVIDVIGERSTRLTKSGIPPKPLWSALNDRLTWQDPKTILYDWDEVDQVRLIYALAWELKLIQPDEERVLDIGPGADAFFCAPPARRAQLLMLAYIAVEDWDERCDARNEQGHRHNFGQTFRRDFKWYPDDMRRALLDALKRAPIMRWVPADALARLVTHAHPDLLISEEDEVPIPLDDNPDPEIARLVEYWVFVAARLGLVDLARTPDRLDAPGGDRLFRLTQLGAALLGVAPNDDSKIAPSDAKVASEPTRPYIVQPNGDVILYRTEADVADEYILRRISIDTGTTDWSEPTITYSVTRASIQAAADAGVDVRRAYERIVRGARAAVPSVFEVAFDDVERHLGRVQVQKGFTMVELDTPSDALLKAIEDAGFERFGALVAVPLSRWAELETLIDGAPEEAFHYPSAIPLVEFDDNTLELPWEAMPLAARDLLCAIGLDPSNDTVTLTDATMAEAARRGWNARAMAEAFTALNDEGLPPLLKAALKTSSS